MSILGLCNRENRPKYLHKGFQYGVLGDARIVHFTSTYLDVRPWVEGCRHPFAERWHEFKDKTPWKGQPLRKDNRNLKKRIVRKLVMCLPSGLRLHVTGIMHAYVKPLKYMIKMNR